MLTHERVELIGELAVTLPLLAEVLSQYAGALAVTVTEFMLDPAEVGLKSGLSDGVEGGVRDRLAQVALCREGLIEMDENECFAEESGLTEFPILTVERDRLVEELSPIESIMLSEVGEEEGAVVELGGLRVEVQVLVERCCGDEVLWFIEEAR